MHVKDSGWSNSDDSPVALIATLVSLSVVCAIVAILATVCLAVVCKRKGGPAPPPSGPAHWSTTVTVTPECRPRSGAAAAGGAQAAAAAAAAAAASGSGQGIPPQGQGQVTDVHGRTRQEQDRMALIAFADGVQVSCGVVHVVPMHRSPQFPVTK